MGYSVIQVPQGQIVKVYQTGSFEFYGIIDGNVRVTASSKFSNILNGKGDSQSTIGKLIDTIAGGDAGSGFSTVWPQMTARIWDSTEPLGVSLDFTYIQGLWGMTGQELVAQVKKIMALSLPRTGGVGGSLIPPGPTIATAWADPAKEKESGTRIADTSPANLDRLSAEARRSHVKFTEQGFSDIIPGSSADIENGIQGFRYKRGRAINIKIGNYLELKNVLIESSNPEFSDICDASGFPIWAKVTIEITTTMSGTVEMLGVDFKEENATATAMNNAVRNVISEVIQTLQTNQGG